MLLISGKAFNKGISFSAKRYTVITEQSSDNEVSIKTKENKTSKVNKAISKLPFVRGAYFSLPQNALIIIVILLILVEVLGLSTNNSYKTMQNELKIVFYAGLIALIFIIWSNIKNKDWLKYHGAEHKLINTYEHYGQLDLETIKSESCLHRSCGTVYFIFLIVFFIMFYVLTWYITLSYLMASSISYEIHSIKNPDRLPVIRYVYKLALIIQRTVVREPTDDQLKLGIAGLSELIRLENISHQ